MPHRHDPQERRRARTVAVFPVYVPHQTVIILLAWWLAAIALPAMLEAPLLVGLTAVLCYALFMCVRRWRWARPLFGLQGGAS